MAIKRYQKKPVVIEAIQLNQGMNLDVIHAFMGDETDLEQFYEIIISSFGAVQEVRINTLEGTMVASPLTRDWIIKGVAGELYPCKPDIFEQTYEEVGVDE